ncbi:MAG TPA: alpha/beta fold hydrolase [Gaiellaceae bacterium]|nr:alpha/beta fold hydrolase [Gaiellaceae bacterium]
MRLHAEVAGEGPAVVLLHEGVCDSRMWEPQWVPWSREFRLLRVDLRGFGRTPLAPGAFTHGRDVIEALERHGFDRFALVGVSLGGRVALELAVARPQLVTALVLVAPGLPGHAWSEQLRAEWAKEEAAFEAGDLDRAVEVSLHTWVDGPRRRPEDVDPEVRARVGEMQRRAYELALGSDEDDEELLVEDLAQRLGEIRAPTLVLVGEEDQPDMHAIAERLEREIPGARRATIAATAHVPSMERPREFDELVLPFLREVG